MSNSPKKEPIVSKEARVENEPEANKSFTVPGGTSLDQINITIKFKSRDEFGPSVGASVKHNVDLQNPTVGASVKHNVDLQAPVVGASVKHNVDLQAPTAGPAAQQNYVTLQQFEELKEQVRQLAEQLKSSPKPGA
jgi:hypothetical protein